MIYLFKRRSQSVIMDDLLSFLIEQGIIVHVAHSNIPLENRVRVRQLIPYLLEELVGTKLVLPPRVFTEKYTGVKYPHSVTSKKAYSKFGLEMEDLVLGKLFELYTLKFKAERNPSTTQLTLTEKEHDTYSSQIVEQLDDISNYFSEYFPPKKIHHASVGIEFVHNTISGHPDLVIYLSPTEVVIFDVKVFATMGMSKSREIKAQLSLYVALARSQGLVCNKAGIIMPWRRKPSVQLYDVSKWKSETLLEVASLAAEKVRAEPIQRIKWTNLLREYNVGSHVHKNDALRLIATKAPTSVPFQLFLYGNNPSADREQKARKEWMKVPHLAFKNYDAYVHAPYNLTLALEEDYIVPAVRMYLEDAARCGFKGVVFHTGHHSNMKLGVENMKKNMQQILEYACPETPFILETPCGNNNELLSTPETFAEFVLNFPERLLGVCLDTCHVFVSGYLPMEYVRRLGSASDRICLIHFNGSRKKKGCHADGHGHVTRVQNIPDEELIPILEKAKEWEISSITE